MARDRSSPVKPMLEIKHFLFQSLCGYFAILFLDFNANGFATEVFGGTEGGSATHERVEDGLSFVTEPLHQPRHKRIRLLRWMVELRFSPDRSEEQTSELQSQSNLL